MKIQEVNIKLVSREGVYGFGISVDGIDDEIIRKLLNLESSPELDDLTDLQALGLKAVIAIVETLLNNGGFNVCDSKQCTIN